MVEADSTDSAPLSLRTGTFAARQPVSQAALAVKENVFSHNSTTLVVVDATEDSPGMMYRVVAAVEQFLFREIKRYECID